MASNQEEEVLGKAYDSRLMRRLLTYLGPYKWHVVIALVAIVLKSIADVLAPFLTKIAIDKYLAKSSNSHSWIGDRLSSAPLVGFFDKSPVGRGVTRVTTDVDALNERFTAGVVSIFEDVFVLAGIIGIMMKMNWKLALITFAVLPLIVFATKIFRDKVRDSYRRIRTAIARINSYLQEAVSGMLVLQLFNR